MRGRKSDVGATRVAPNGYHYTREPQGWVLTARLYMSEWLGRELESHERVIYKDGNKLNLQISNLELKEIMPSSPKARLARLYAKLDEIQSEINEIEEQEQAKLESLNH